MIQNVSKWGEKQWQHKKNEFWGCMTEEESQENKGTLRKWEYMVGLRYSKRIWKRGGIQMEQDGMQNGK